MLADISTMNPKGHVTVELYNDQGVFYKKEKKNLVVQSANKIVAEMMADPSKVIRVPQIDKGDANLPYNGSLHSFPLSVKREAKGVFENNWGSLNEQTVFEIEELKEVSKIEDVQVDGVSLTLDVDVFIRDASIGKIEFAEAPKEHVVIRYQKVINKYLKIIEGTETVKVDGELWSRASVANSDEKKYQINFQTGDVVFETPQTNVEVSYDIHMSYALGFMALGGKPNAEHKDYQPVQFGNSDKLEVNMKNELAGSRMPIQFPASISLGATELEPAIPTKPVATVLKEEDVTIASEEGQKVLVYSLPNTHNDGYGESGKVLYLLESVFNVTKGTVIENDKVTIEKNNVDSLEVRLEEGLVEEGDVVQFKYRLKLDNRHLTYQLGQSPVVELDSVLHTDVNGNITSYNIDPNTKGLTPNSGDVWISNPNTGHITFSAEPTGGPKVETPGQIQVKYRVNSGTVVTFVADFPVGVPAPVVEETVKSVVATSGQTSIPLDYAVVKDENGAFVEPEITVTTNGDVVTLDSSQYNISVDGRTISIDSLTGGDHVLITHKYEKTTHDIYQVAMFDDISGGRMFNISGIGPITKDKNTGMRVSWAVTF